MSVLITVKAYPQLSRRRGETVCVAGLRDLGERFSWTRLFPVRFRDLQEDKQFRKYQFVHLTARKDQSDARPETYTPDLDSIEAGEFLESKGHGLQRRRQAIESVLTYSMCAVQRRSREDGTSLGAFRPAEVYDVEAEPVQRDWTPEARARAQSDRDQLDLLDPDKEPKEPVDKIPYDFKYLYRCHDSDCSNRSTPHRQTIIDWEIGALFRNLRRRGDDEKTAVEKVRQKFLDELCGQNRDTVFFTGNAKRYPNVFMILGVWSPSTTGDDRQEKLF